MPKDSDILRRMRDAQVPPYAYTTTLKLEKQEAFSEIVQNREYDLGPSGLVSYVVRPGKKPRAGRPEVTRVCAVAAKELVLQRRKVFYTTIPELITANRMYERGIPSILTYIDRVGEGYIVLGDVGLNTHRYVGTEWDEAQALLLAHLSRGGALIVGETDDGQATLIRDMAETISQFSVASVE